MISTTLRRRKPSWGFGQGSFSSDLGRPGHRGKTTGEDLAAAERLPNDSTFDFIIHAYLVFRVFARRSGAVGANASAAGGVQQSTGATFAV